MPSASQVAGEDAGVIRQVDAVLNPVGDVAIPLVPVSVVKATVPPGITAFASGVAVGTGGNATVGVIVAEATCVLVSAITYFTAVATPEKVDNGSNVTVPFAFTVYVP